MAKRTRRNLSDPRIQRILKTYQQSSPGGPVPYSDRGASRFLRNTLWLLLLVMALAAGYYALNSRHWSFLDGGPKAGPALQTGRATSGGQPAQQPHPATQGGEKHAPAEQATPPASEAAAEKTESPSPKPEPVPRGIQVQVLNGCGAPGVAARVTRYLRKNNIDVVLRDNYKSFNVKETFILDRVDNPERMAKIARALGLPQSRIRLQKDENLQVDATIVIGADFKSLKPFQSK